MDVKNYQRKQYFIEKSFQTKFILMFCSIVILSSCLILGVVVFLLGDKSNTVMIKNTQVTVTNTADFVLPITLQTIIIVSIFSVISLIIMMVYTSHKISGPLYRLTSDLAFMAKNKDLRKDLKIRGDDQLKKLCDNLNGVNLVWRQQYINLQTHYKSLIFFLEEKDFQISTKEQESFKKKVIDFDNILKEFKV